MKKEDLSKSQNCNGHCSPLHFIKGGGKLKVELTNPMLRDKLHILSVEYNLPEEMLVNGAVKRLVDDVDFVRNLRIGQTERA